MTSAPTPCSQPNPCEDGELCGQHEVEQAHADGDHEYCGVTCEVQFPSDMLRNGVLAKGYPGTAGMLDELLRRAAAQPPELRARLDAAIRPTMLLGLQDAELFDKPGTQRINEWADWILDTVLKALTTEETQR